MLSSSGENGPEVTGLTDDSSPAVQMARHHPQPVRFEMILSVKEHKCTTRPAHAHRSLLGSSPHDREMQSAWPLRGEA